MREIMPRNRQSLLEKGLENVIHETIPQRQESRIIFDYRGYLALLATTWLLNVAY